MERASMNYIRWMLSEIGRLEGRPAEPSKTVDGKYAQNEGALTIDHIPGSGYKVEEMGAHGTTELTSLRMTRRELQYFLEGWLMGLKETRSRSPWHHRPHKSETLEYVFGYQKGEFDASRGAEVPDLDGRYDMFRERFNTNNADFSQFCNGYIDGWAEWEDRNRKSGYGVEYAGQNMLR